MNDTWLVEITYSPQPWEIGEIKELPRDAAQLLIREGRAKRHHGPVPDPAIAPRTTVVPPAQSSPARQVEASETPASATAPAKTSTTRRTTTPSAAG